MSFKNPPIKFLIKINENNSVNPIKLTQLPLKDTKIVPKLLAPRFSPGKLATSQFRWFLFIIVPRKASS